jgi:hypothetical protein
MKPAKKLFVMAFVFSALTAGAWAGDPPSSEAKAKDAVAPPAAPAPAIVTAADVQALKDALAAQQLQIERLEQQLQRQQEQQAAVEASRAEVEAVPQQQLAEASAAVAAQPETVAQAMENPQVPDSRSKPMEGPLTIHFRGINITPGGFAAAEFLRRSRALGADIITPFNSLTMPGASQSSLPEFFATARQSRPTVFISSRAASVDFFAYVSGDFLASGVTSTATQANGYALRLRQVWGEAKFPHGWSVLGGQAWSLVTENKAGIGPSDDAGRMNDARPTTIDGQYSIGFSFARQDGIRLTKSFGDKFAAAFAVENAQATVTSSGNTNDYLLVQPGASNTNNSTSTYGFNPSPDLIAKIAFDPGFGHYEIFGLFDRFQDRVFPCDNFISAGTPPVVTAVLPACPALKDGGTAAGAYNASKNGGGFGANARWAFFNRHIVFGLHGFGGSGVGRYGAGQLSDVSINADGTVHLIKDLQGLVTLEWHGKKLDLYSYVGSEYAARTYGYDPIQSLTSTTPVIVGYGAPTFNDTGCYTETAPGTSVLVPGPVPGSLSKCSAQTRDITEGTMGFWYRFHNGPRGRYQWGMQYSYANRATWADEVHGLEPHGLDSMVFTSFRYYLP